MDDGPQNKSSFAGLNEQKTTYIYMEYIYELLYYQNYSEVHI